MPRLETGFEAEWCQRGSGAHTPSCPAPPRGDERLLPLHDRERLGALLARLEPRLEAVALRITRHPEHARDVVQNAFEKALRHGAGFRGESRVSTWLHRIVANEALMWLRSQRRRPEVQELPSAEELPCTSEEEGPSGPLVRRERARALHRGLRLLSREERDVMLHCGLADESYAAYAARHGIRPAAVKSRAFRARRRLGAILRESCL